MAGLLRDTMETIRGLALSGLSLRRDLVELPLPDGVSEPQANELIFASILEVVDGFTATLPVRIPSVCEGSDTLV